jgi:hypothetical protein
VMYDWGAQKRLSSMPAAARLSQATAVPAPAVSLGSSSMLG